MKTKIKMVDFKKPFLNFTKGKAIKLSTKSSKVCLKKSGTKSSDLGVIIYTGIYREKHLVEPAIASLIQKRIGANSTLNGKNQTFSFDLNNGGCGLVSGFQLIDGFIQSGRANHGMIVCGDTEPYSKLSLNFHFSTSAASVILSSSENGYGFIRFKTETFPQYKHEFKSSISWSTLKKSKKKRNVLLVTETNDYMDLCVKCACQTLEKFLYETEINLSDIDLIIPSQNPGGFVPKLKKELNLDQRIIEVDCQVGVLHTAGPAAALEKAWLVGSFTQAKNILFLTVGSGITTALALYKNA